MSKVNPNPPPANPPNANPPPARPPLPPGKLKRFKVRDQGKWKDVDGDEVAHAGRKWIRYTDENGYVVYQLV